MTMCMFSCCNRLATVRGFCARHYVNYVYRSRDEDLHHDNLTTRHTITAGRMCLVDKRSLPDRDSFTQDDIIDLNDAIRKLPRHRRTILELRLGLHGPVPSFREIGEQFGLSGSRINQLEGSAVRRLQHILTDMNANREVMRWQNRKKKPRARKDQHIGHY